MPGSLFQIARSGAAAARASIELTAQNIANSDNPDYARRSLEMRELVGQQPGQRGVLNGVEILGISRNDSFIVQQQARISSSELERADAELDGLRTLELVFEESRLYETLVEYEAVVTRLESNPLDPALRTSVIEAGRQLASTFQFADKTLETGRAQSQQSAAASISEANLQSAELARINRDLANARPGTAGQAALLDARDAALRNLSNEISITPEFDDLGRATVRADASPPVLLVSTTASATVSAVTNPNGTIDIRIGAQSFTPTAGAAFGHASALRGFDEFARQLDSLAITTISLSTSGQLSGADINGTRGNPIFSGNSAATIAMALTDGSQIATAPLGSPPGSTDTSNLRAYLDRIGREDGPVQSGDRTLLRLSSRISALETRREGVFAIAENARSTLLSETGVDLDTEAANLVRLQQAFEANGRILQVATDIFDTLLAIR